MRIPHSIRGSQPPSGEQFIQKLISARKGFIAFLPLIVAGCMLMAATAVSTFFYSPSTAVYQCYANAFWFGAKTSQILPASQCLFLPQLSQYHSLPLEYPPLTLFIFSLPLVAPAAGYAVMFALFMGLIVAIIFGLLLRYGPRGAGAFFAACLVVGCLATSLARFDIVPAAFTLGCLILADHKQWTWAYLALAVGVLLKLYPIVLFPLLFLAEQREQPSFFIKANGVSFKTVPGFFQVIRNLRNWRWKNALMFGGVVLGVSVFFWLVISRGAISMFAYLYQRPFQLESIGSVLLWLASFIGIPVDWRFSFGSVNTISPIAGGLSQGFVVLLWVGLIYIFIQQWKGKMDLVQASVAALLVLLATSKVFSPQYLLWLIPLAAYSASDKRKMWLLWGGISILTTLIFPIFYWIMGPGNDPSQAPGLMLTIMVRNGLFVLLTIAYLFNFRDMQKRSTIDGITNVPERVER